MPKPRPYKVPGAGSAASKFFTGAAKTAPGVVQRLLGLNAGVSPADASLIQYRQALIEQGRQKTFLDMMKYKEEPERQKALKAFESKLAKEAGEYDAAMDIYKQKTMAEFLGQTPEQVSAMKRDDLANAVLLHEQKTGIDFNNFTRERNVKMPEIAADLLYKKQQIQSLQDNAEIGRQQVDIQRERLELDKEMDRLANDLAVDRLNFDKAQQLEEFNYNKAKDQFDAETTIALAEYKGLLQLATSDNRLDPLTKGLISGMFIYEERALMEPSNDNIEMFERSRKLLEHTLVTNYGYEVKLPKVEFKRNWRPGLNILDIGKKQLKETEPPTIKVPQKQSTPPSYSGPKNILGVTKKDTTQEGPPLYAGKKLASDTKSYAKGIKGSVTIPFGPSVRRIIEEDGYDPDEVENAIKALNK